jgi:CRISPR-associated protein Cas5t
MRAVRVEAEGLTTSFRYPHFLVGRQPTFRMPPPATIYGHICSAAGEHLDPEGLRFGYVFRAGGSGDDLELLHMATVGKGRIRELGGIPKNLDVTTNVLPREILFQPRLTLYVTAEDDRVELLWRAFREPRYVVTLGRSQDLMAYRRVDLVDLHEQRDAYLEATLLPWSFRPRTTDGIGVTMPRFIDPNDRRNVIWSPFVMLENRAPINKDVGGPPRARRITRMSDDERWWVDADSPTIEGTQRAVIWHSFRAEDDGGWAFISPAS